jgi:hypothetical protein
MGIFTLLLLPSNPIPALVGFFIVLCITQSSGGLTAPAWFDIVGKVIPSGFTGTYFGLANFLACMFGIAGGLATIEYFALFSYPTSYAVCFFSAFFLMIMSFLSLSVIEERPSDVSKDDRGLVEYAKTLPELIGSDKEFQKFVLVSVLGTISSMGPTFFVISALKSSALLPEQIGSLTVASLIGQLISNFAWMKLASARGHRIVLAVGATMDIAACVLAALSNNILGFILVFVLRGFSLTTAIVSGNSLIFDLSPVNKRPTYFALSGIVKTPFYILAPLAGGIIADLLGYTPIYMITSIVLVFQVILLLLMKIPSEQPI